MDKNKRVQILLERKEKLKNRLEGLRKEFEEEKENEDAWPGHDTNFLLQLEQDQKLIVSMLGDIEKELKELN